MSHQLMWTNILIEFLTNNMIILNVYGDFIMCSGKCGSRYLNGIFENDLRINALELPKQTLKTEYIVVREPHGHLITALHTDLLHIWNNYWPGMTEQEVIDRLTTTGGGHYSLNLYKWIYEYWENTDKFAKIIDLSELTSLVKEKGFDIPYDKTEYDWNYFDVWKTKEEIVEYVSKTYPNQYQIMMERLESEKEYYKKLLKK